MRSKGWSISILTAVSLCFAQVGAAQSQSKKGHIVIPASSVASPGDAGKIAHTNLRLMLPDSGPLPIDPASFR